MVRSFVPEIILAFLLNVPLASQTLPQVAPPYQTEGANGGTGDPTTPCLEDSPANTSHVPLRMGSVDAIGGELTRHIPLGPKLPGRIPIGFPWVFRSMGPRDSYYSITLGGTYVPVVWPNPDLNNPKITAWVNGQPIEFVKGANPTAGLPSPAKIRTWLQSRNVDNASSFPVSTI